MPTMKWFALLSLISFISADVVLTDIPFVIPGADFVGYGYDIRYLATEHAVRFPLINWTYTNARTYAYPLNRDDVYLVPDQMFVRTVARTDAESYVFSTLDELTKTESDSKGLTTEAYGEFDPLQYLPAENRTKLYDDLQQKYSNYSGAKILTPKIKFESKGFTLGSEVTSTKSALTKNENYYVRNRQVNQLYQLFLDKRPLRKALEDDMQSLYNKVWADNQEEYEAFFERYGTHVVVSAMLGGAISLDSIVQKTAIQSIQSTVSNFSQQENSTHIDQKNETVPDTLVRDSPLCNGTQTGYGWNPYKSQCELLPETRCYNPMDDVFKDYFTAYDNNQSTPWSQPGPMSPPSRGSRLECHNAVPWCRDFWLWGWCYYWEVCNWVDLGPYPNPAISISTLPVTGCSSCKSVVIDNTANGNYVKQRIGQSRNFATQPNPQLISFYTYFTEYYQDHAIVDIVDTRDQNKDDDDFSFLQFMQLGNSFGLRAYDSVFSSFSVPLHIANFGRWFEIRLVLNYTDKSADLWYRDASTNVWLLGEKGHKFYRADTVDAYRVGRVNLYNVYNARDLWSGFQFCNPLDGPPYTPLTTHMAVSMTTAKFKQVVSGKLDTSFENTYNKFTLYQSNNWKLKGGDSSMVDLLNFRQSTDVFEAWKGTIQGNPAPVQFTLKEISQFFPDIGTIYGENITMRDLVKQAVREFLTVETTLDPIIDTNLNDTIIA